MLINSQMTPDVMSTMRVLAKFIGLLVTIPFNYEGPRNSAVDERQINLRNKAFYTFYRPFH